MSLFPFFLPSFCVSTLRLHLQRGLLGPNDPLTPRSFQKAQAFLSIVTLPFSVVPVSGDLEFHSSTFHWNNPGRSPTQGLGGRGSQCPLPLEGVWAGVPVAIMRANLPSPLVEEIVHTVDSDVDANFVTWKDLFLNEKSTFQSNTIQALTHAHARTQAHGHTRAHTHGHTRTHMHARAHTGTHARTHAHGHLCPRRERPCSLSNPPPSPLSLPMSPLHTLL